MIDIKRAMTGPTLALNNAQKEPALEQPYDIVEQLLAQDLNHTPPADVEEEDAGKRENDLEDDLSSLETGPLDIDTSPLELEEMSIYTKISLMTLTISMSLSSNFLR